MFGLIGLIQRSKLQLRWKLLGGFLTANLLLVVALIIALFTLFNTTRALQSLRESNERFQLLSQIETQQQYLVVNALDYIWNHKISQQTIYEISKTNLARDLNAFQPASLQKDNFAGLKQEIATLQEQLDRMIKLTDLKDPDDAKLVWQSRASKQANTVQSILKELSQQETHVATGEYEQADEQAINQGWLISALGGLALLLAAGLALLLTAALNSPVAQLKRRLRDLAGGDLSQPVQVVNRDELGELGQTYNATLVSLGELVNQLFAQSQQVSAATEELTSQAKSQVAGSSQQASAITEATQALKELNQTAEEITRQTSRTSEAAAFALGRAQAVSELADRMVVAQDQGRATVAHTIEALSNLKAQVEAIEEQQGILSKQSTSIQSIVGIINGIAKETHLLALNAAIEAAGAGVYGERFSVIASEVKQLSDRSMQATEEVRAALAGIAQAVEEANLRAEEGLREAEEAVIEAGTADKALLELTTLSVEVKAAAHDILGEVQNTASLSANIGIATRQQQVSSHQMLEKMLQIEAVTSQTLSATRQGEAVTYQLNQTARELETSATKFKLVAA
jgi:methyl-accepting chemotaxis protein